MAINVFYRLGQAPIDDEGLAVLADDHVARLDVAMQDAPAVRASSRSRCRHRPNRREEVAQLQGLSRPRWQLQREVVGVNRSIDSFRLSPRTNRMA